MRINHKIILGYVILVFIPVLAFGYYYYSQIYGNLSDQFAESRQKILEQAYANMKTDFVRIQTVHRLLQYNPYLTDYLDGAYESDAESVYAYLRYISPLFTQSLFANPDIRSMIVYKAKDKAMPIATRIVDVSLLEPRAEEAFRTMKPGQGAWVWDVREDSEPGLIYYQNLYNTQFTEKIGMLEIQISGSLIRKFYQAAGAEGYWKAYLLSEQGEPLPSGGAAMLIDDGTLRRLPLGQNAYLINRKTIVNQLYVEELGVHAIVTGRVGDVFNSIKRKEAVLLTTIFVLLTALSVAYYMLASTITKRILRLARHMRTVSDANLSQRLIKPDKSDEKDEIGFLTATYNAMIRRMDELINNVHRAELRNKEAAYQVLQAQIKPHFLYNTLETIRMVAESNDDKEAADLSFWFGKLMRYSLSSRQEETVLAREIEMVTFYLNIHKMRLQNRLTYEIDVATDAERIRCPRFILQPLIENGIVHGTSTVLRPVHIRLAATESNEELRIAICDNGSGMAPEKLAAVQANLARRDEPGEGEPCAGVGLKNVNERIKSYFGEASRLEIASEQGKGTCLSVILVKREETER